MPLGTSSPRREGKAKVTGQARYVDDLAFPGMLHGVTVRSPSPRGLIRAIHYGPGIPWQEFTIVTAADIPGANRVALIVDDQPYLAAIASTIPRSRSCCSRIPTGSCSKRAPRGDDRRRARTAGLHDGRRAGAASGGVGRGQRFKPYASSAATSRRRSRRRRSSSRASTRPARRSSCTSSRKAWWRWPSPEAASRSGARCSARTTSTRRWRRCSSCPPSKFASCRWRPAAGSAARRSIRRSSPATRRCWRGSRAGR